MFVNQKAQEISYALIRIAAYIRRQELRQRMEKLALQLLEDIAGTEFEAALRTTARVESLIGIGKEIYEVESTNAKVILGELNALNAAIRQIAGLEELSNLESVFSGAQQETQKSPMEMNLELDNITAGISSGNGANASIRQSAIIEKIRQSGNRQVQLRDILGAFPEVSERTMRYDLQKLCTQGLVERVGNGGPGSYYLLKA